MVCCSESGWGRQSCRRAGFPAGLYSREELADMIVDPAWPGHTLSLPRTHCIVSGTGILHVIEASAKLVPQTYTCVVIG